MHPPTPTPAGSSRRSLGILLLASSLLSVVFMAMHPTSKAHDLAGLTRDAAGGMRGMGPIHAILIGLQVLITCAATGLGDLLGWSRARTRLACGLMLLACGMGVAAGVVNGFVVPSFLASYSQQDLPIERQVVMEGILRVLKFVNATCARGDVIASSLATLLWGTLLLPARGLRVIVAIVACACGLVPLALTLGGMKMDVQGFGLFVAMQAVWGVAAGVLLVRQAPRDASN